MTRDSVNVGPGVRLLLAGREDPDATRRSSTSRGRSRPRGSSSASSCVSRASRRRCSARTASSTRPASSSPARTSRSSRSPRTSRLITRVPRARTAGTSEYFGAPTYAATQVVVNAIERACQNGTATRAEVRAQIKRTDIAARTRARPSHPVRAQRRHPRRALRNLPGRRERRVQPRRLEPTSTGVRPLQTRGRTPVVRTYAMRLRAHVSGGVGSAAVVLAGFGGLLAYVVFRTDSNWALFFQLTVNGLTLGSVYALIALGYSMVYGILKLLNFAHGDVYMIGAFIGYGVLTLLGGAADPAIPVGAARARDVPRRDARLRACSASCIERFAYRPLRDAPRIAPLISALGVSFFLQNSALLLFGANFRSYDTFTLVDHDRGYPTWTSAAQRSRSCASSRSLSAFALMVVLTLFVARTQARQGDARDVVRPRGGVDDGHRRRPRDRGHVLHRLGARRRGRRHVRPRLQPDLPLDGLLRRAQGVHGRRHRRDRHRFPARCSAGC